MPPKITVITATYNRSEHIVPTLKSALSQTFEDFEYLVIGDCVSDDTSVHVANMKDPRLRWINNEKRSRSQSGPNARGLAEAKGKIVAYLGHDDIWAPDHLEHLIATYERHDPVFAVASCCIMYALSALHAEAYPERVFGFFDSVDRYEPQFFAPPSSLSHRLHLPSAPVWRPREGLEEPVDVDFQRQMLSNGVRLVSTGVITTHKWASSVRYLSYLLTDTERQEDMLALLSDRARAKAHNDKMSALARENKVPHGSMAPRGNDALRAMLKRVDQVRGLALPPIRSLKRRTTLQQTAEKRGADWRKFHEKDRPYRWCGPSHRPRMLVPFTCKGEVEFKLQAQVVAKRGLTIERIQLNGQDVDFDVENQRKERWFSRFDLVFRGSLKRDAPSVLQFFLPADTFVPLKGSLRNGFAIADAVLTPIDNTFFHLGRRRIRWGKLGNWKPWRWRFSKS